MNIEKLKSLEMENQRKLDDIYLNAYYVAREIIGEVYGEYNYWKEYPIDEWKNLLNAEKSIIELNPDMKKVAEHFNIKILDTELEKKIYDSLGVVVNSNLMNTINNIIDGKVDKAIPEKKEYKLVFYDVVSYLGYAIALAVAKIFLGAGEEKDIVLKNRAITYLRYNDLPNLTYSTGFAEMVAIFIICPIEKILQYEYYFLKFRHEGVFTKQHYLNERENRSYEYFFGIEYFLSNFVCEDLFAPRRVLYVYSHIYNLFEAIMNYETGFEELEPTIKICKKFYFKKIKPIEKLKI